MCPAGTHPYPAFNHRFSLKDGWRGGQPQKVTKNPTFGEAGCHIWTIQVGLCYRIEVLNGNWSWPAENSNSLSEPRVLSTKHLGFRLSFWNFDQQNWNYHLSKKNKDSYKCISGNQFENIPLPPKREVRSSWVFRLYDMMFETNQINIKQIQPHSHVRQNISTIWSWSAFEGINPNKKKSPLKNPWSPNKRIFTSIPLPSIPPFPKKNRTWPSHLSPSSPKLSCALQVAKFSLHLRPLL